MTQQPFSRPGAIDLSGLKRPAQPPPGAGPTGGPGATGARGGVGSAYAVDVDEQNFQGLLEASMTAPVVLVFYSTSQAPESVTMAADVATVAGEYDGRFLAGLIDIDASPAIAQAMQIPQVPMLFVLLDGRPATQPIPGLINLEELRTLFQQLGQQLTAQGITGRHQPRSTVPPAGVAEDPEEPFVDPRYAAAQDALGEGNIDLAVAEYQKLVDGNPADTEAAAGLAMAKLLQRTQGVDLQAARAAAAASPDDVDAQTMVADLDMLGGHVDDAFTRLIDVVRRTADADRNKAREHLITLFGAVGNDDPRVRKARQNLASALF
jgi:putative thioredoxin